MGSYEKPVPQVTDANRPFWEGLRQRRLRLQKCAGCGHVRYPISTICPRCLGERHEWVDLSGTGEVFSYVVFHQLYNRAFADDVPYNVALVQLDEGPRMFSNVVGVANEDVRVGDRVRIVFDPVTEDLTLPRFTPDGGAAGRDAVG